MNLQNKIFQLVSLILITLITIILISFYYYFQKSSELLFVSLFERAAIQSSSNVQKFLSEKVNNIVRLSKNPVFLSKNYDEKAIASALTNSRNAYDNFESLEYLDKDFNVLSQTSRVGIGELSDNKDLALMVKSSYQAQADFITSAKFKKSQFRICVPILDEKKRIKNYVIALVPLEKVSDFYSAYDSDFGGMVKPNVYMVSTAGKLIYKNHENDFSPIFSKALLRLGHKEEDSARLGDDYVFISRPILHDAIPVEKWVLLINFSYADLDYPIHLTRNWILFLIVLVLAAVFLVIKKSSENIVAPINLINSKFKTLSHGKFEEIKLDEQVTHEFAELIEGYNLMVNRLRQSMAELNQRSKLEALGQMASGIAHEVNNPLAIIKGHAEKLMIILGSNAHPHVMQSVNEIGKTVDRIVAIVNSLRVFSRSGEQEDFDLVDVKKIISLTMDLCSERLKQNQVRMDILIPPQALALDCRAVQISQILLNLITNAYDAIKTEREKWIRLEVQARSGLVQFSVTNSGPKISNEVLEKIFVPFFTTKPVSEGTGLGLSISKGIAEAHHGQLFVDTDQVCTCFKLVLPQVQGRLIDKQ